MKSHLCMFRLKASLLLLVLTLVSTYAWEYNAGVGKADVTGPAAEVIFLLLFAPFKMFQLRGNAIFPHVN